jgi:hypothetical protein
MGSFLMMPVEIRLNLFQDRMFLGHGCNSHFIEVVETHGAVLQAGGCCHHLSMKVLVGASGWPTPMVSCA